MKRKQPTNRRKPSAPGERQLVLLDQDVLRRKAARRCSKRMQELEALQLQVSRFEQEDRPAYAQWLAANFGPLLTQLRDNAILLNEKQRLVFEIEEELMFGNSRTYRQAYVAVLKRRDAPPEPGSQHQPGDPRDPFGDPFDDFFGDHLEDDPDEAFDEFVFEATGLFPEELSAREYNRLEKEFQAQRRAATPENAQPHQNPQQPHKETRACRIKELYRLLVRRLHPDTRSDSDAKTAAGAAALWHEVQAAYEQGDLGRLETLAARTELQAVAAGAQGDPLLTGLSRLRATIKEIESSISALRTTLYQLRADPAWDFAYRSKTKAFARHKDKVARELKEELAHQISLLNEFAAMQARWSQSPRSKPKPRTKSKTSRHPGTSRKTASDWGDIPL